MRQQKRILRVKERLSLLQQTVGKKLAIKEAVFH
jgi:hypothetical protein